MGGSADGVPSPKNRRLTENRGVSVCIIAYNANRSCGAADRGFRLAWADPGLSAVSEFSVSAIT